MVCSDQLIGHLTEKPTIFTSRPLEQQACRLGLDPQSGAVTWPENVGAEHKQLAHAHPTGIGGLTLRTLDGHSLTSCHLLLHTHQG
jgi:hypothetical protein